jgi:dipeptidyl-peptidase-4
LLHHTAALPSNYPSTKKVATFADVFSGNFTVEQLLPSWTSQGKDGNYLTTNGTDIVFGNIVTGNTSTFVSAKDIGEAAKDYYDYSIQGNG